MAKEILICPKCNEYTLKEIHCDKKTKTIKPAKFSPEDRWGYWRRLEKSRSKNGMEDK